MLVPSTPTSASGAFWKGSELGTDPPAQPAAPSTTSEVVKSKSTSHPAGEGTLILPPKAHLKHPCPQHWLWDERAPAPNIGHGKEQAWQKGGEKEHSGARHVGMRWEATPDPLPNVAVQSWSAGGGPSGLTTRSTAPRRSPPSPPSRCLTSSTPATGSRLMWWPSSCARWARGYRVGDETWTRDREPRGNPRLPVHVASRTQVIEKEQPQLTECEEPSIYSPAFPREKWQRKRTQVKIRVWALPLAASGARPCPLSPASLLLTTFLGPSWVPPPHRVLALPLGTKNLLPFHRWPDPCSLHPASSSESHPVHPLGPAVHTHS